MNLLPVQYQALRAVRQVVPRNNRNRRELHRMHSAFGAGTRPSRIEYGDGRLWVALEGQRPGFSFVV